jgi:surfeit locus 1 family protein
MPSSLTLGTRRLVLRWPWLVLAVAAAALFTSLGFWQWGRGVHRAQVWAELEGRAATTPIAATGERLNMLPPSVRVRVEGRLDGAHQLLLDNITRDGRPGYEVLTPLDLADGATVLVNRGWVAFTGYRDRLPDVAVAGDAPVTLVGSLSPLPTPGLASGSAPPALDGPWPRVTAYPTSADLARALGRPVAEPVLRLDADSGPGYDRRWPLPGIAPERNFSYAIQWWSFALLALALFVFLNLEKRR